MEIDIENLKDIRNSLKNSGRIDPKYESILKLIINEEMSKVILDELKIEGEVIGIFPYGSRVYGYDTEQSDSDYIIVMKSAMLDNGAFRNNAISNDDYTIQGVVYSRGGFIDAINNYEIGALECLFLPEDKVILKKWSFKITNWNTQAMVKSIIRKASDSRHYSNMSCKNGDRERGMRSMFHALRILKFGLQLKEHQKIVDYSESNELYKNFMSVDPEDFDSRDYFKEFDELVKELKK